MKQAFRRVGVLAALVTTYVFLVASSAQAEPFVVGDVFAGVASGNVAHFSSTGVLKATYNIGASGFTTGMAFDGSGNLYVTGLSANTLAKFDTNGNLLNANVAAGLSTPESVVFDQAGNFYVGNLGNGIRKYDATGTFVGTVINERVDWLDLSADQSKFVYGQEGNVVKTVSNGTPGVAGANFASGLSSAFAMRYLSDGGLLVADYFNVKRFDAAGTLIKTYDVGTEDSWFSLNLDSDGTSFWSGNFSTGNAYKFDIATGNMLFSFNAIAGASRLFGLAVYGEITEGGPPPQTGTPDAGSTAALLALAFAAAGCLRSKMR
jgi:hypothetical protein